MNLVVFQRPDNSTTDYARVLDKLRWVRVHSPTTAAGLECALDNFVAKIATQHGITPPAFVPAPRLPGMSQDDTKPDHRPAGAEDDPDLQDVRNVWRVLPATDRRTLRLTALMLSQLQQHRTAFARECRLLDDSASAWLAAVGSILSHLGSRAIDAFTQATQPGTPPTYRAHRAILARILMQLATTKHPYDNAPHEQHERELKAQALHAAYDRMNPADQERAFRLVTGLEAHRQQESKPLRNAIAEVLRHECGLQELRYFGSLVFQMLSRWAERAGTERPEARRRGRRPKPAAGGVA